MADNQPSSGDASPPGAGDASPEARAEWTLTVTGTGGALPDQAALFDRIRGWAGELGHVIHDLVIHSGHQAAMPPSAPAERARGYDPAAEAERVAAEGVHPSAEDPGMRAATQDRGPVTIPDPSALPGGGGGGGGGADAEQTGVVTAGGGGGGGAQSET